MTGGGLFVYGGFKLRIIVFSFLIFFIFSQNEVVFSEDYSEAINIAKKVFEGGATLRSDDLSEYYCDNSKNMISFARDARKSILDFYEKNGIDYYKQEFHDFSRLEYELIKNDNYIFIVKVEGVAIQGFKDTDFLKKTKINKKLKILKNSDGYCYSVK